MLSWLQPFQCKLKFKHISNDSQKWKQFNWEMLEEKLEQVEMRDRGIRKFQLPPSQAQSGRYSRTFQPIKHTRGSCITIMSFRHLYVFAKKCCKSSQFKESSWFHRFGRCLSYRDERATVRFSLEFFSLFKHETWKRSFTFSIQISESMREIKKICTLQHTHAWSPVP